MVSGSLQCPHILSGEMQASASRRLTTTERQLQPHPAAAACTSQLVLLAQLVEDAIEIEATDTVVLPHNTKSKHGHSFVGRTLEYSLVDEDSFERLGSSIRVNPGRLD